MKYLFATVFVVALVILVAYSVWSLFVSIRDYVKRRKEKKEADQKKGDE